jgi:hypothetical protein
LLRVKPGIVRIVKYRLSSALLQTKGDISMKSGTKKRFVIGRLAIVEARRVTEEAMESMVQRSASPANAEGLSTKKPVSFRRPA